jgi:ATP-dependent Lhr-like helicase
MSTASRAARLPADLAPLADWVRGRGWKPFPFQTTVWRAAAEGHSGLLHAPTGTGKTLAAWLGALARARRTAIDRAAAGAAAPAGPRVLWITPLRALAADTLRALEAPLPALAGWLAPHAGRRPPRWQVAARTGDTPAAERRRLRQRWPEGLVTTPETISLLLSLDDCHEVFAGLETVIVDEWHELLSTKRGVQTELALARLRTLAPGLVTWGLSATLANLDDALAALVGPGAVAASRLVSARIPRRLRIDTLVPEPMERFPWAGHMGMRLLPQVLGVLEGARTSLVFTNTRSQAERWFDAIRAARPEWRREIALHHGSVDRELREAAEEGLRRGRLRCVVATSSLDLGVDFGPVEQVLQVGSPKGIARLLQRAGRSGHAPGATGRLVCVPTHALELVECAAARRASAEGVVEPRPPLEEPLDVLAQHLVTVASSGGFRAADLLAEVRSTRAYARLDDRSWRWALDFAARGGPALAAYPDFARLVERFGRWYVASPAIARRHRMSIGTITGDATVEVRWVRGGRLGTVEESFVSRLAPGDRFLFAGRALSLFRFDGLVAWVRRSRAGPQGLAVPRWNGGRMPLTTLLSRKVLELVRDAAEGAARLPGELRAVLPLLETQARWSRLPDADMLLVERAATGRTARGEPAVRHAFLFPFEGRLVHEGLATLVAWRIARDAPSTFQIAATDWGLQLAGRRALPDDPEAWRRLLSPAGLLEDLLECLRGTEMARRHFREVARVAGLVASGGRSARQTQASAGLIFDVLSEHDAGNMLLEQARREVLERQFEYRRLEAALERIATLEIVVVDTPRISPLAFPLWAEHIQSRLTTQGWLERIMDMARDLERSAAAPPSAP